MEIKTLTQDGITIIQIEGRLDANTAPQAQDTIIPLIVNNCCLVVDLSTCEYISSAGLRLLLMIAKQLPAKNGRSVLSGLSEEIKDVMEMTGFSGHFKDYATVQEAVTALK